MSQARSSDRTMVALTVFVHLVAPAALLFWLLVDMLSSGGASALREMASGLAVGFGIVAALSAGLLALAVALLALLAPEGLVERSY
jgi:hypothetical protein